MTITLPQIGGAKPSVIEGARVRASPPDRPSGALLHNLDAMPATLIHVNVDRALGERKRGVVDEFLPLLLLHWFTSVSSVRRTWDRARSVAVSERSA